MAERRPAPAVPLTGDLIRTARLAAGWTPEDLAGELGCSARTVRRYEAGERVPGREQAARIVVALGIDVAALVGTLTRR